MAKKSKTQRAKASARRQERKADLANQDVQDLEAAEPEVEEKKKGLLKRSSDGETKPAKKEESKPAKKEKKKDGFIANVRAEMKRVTWPTRTDVIRWSGVVVGALIFFSLYVFVLDNWIVTPLLLAISGLGA